MNSVKNVICCICKKDESILWHKSVRGIECNDCIQISKASSKVAENTGTQSAQKTSCPQIAEKPKSTKKSTKLPRSRATRQNPNALPKQVPPKGKGRRFVFKRNPPIKLTPAPSTYVTVDELMYEGQLFRKGDIVSCRDTDDLKIYYAQIKGLMRDQYCEKSCSLTWLLPTEPRSQFVKEGFDPMTFVKGPDDDLPRKLECFEFVMSCPQNYYWQDSPFATGIPHPLENKYVWTRLHRHV